MTLAFASIPVATFFILWAMDASEKRVGSSFKQAYLLWKNWFFSMSLIAGAAFLLFVLSWAGG
jgi:asparagine N-glycosylation enzyme membrane subunit Stt3